MISYELSCCCCCFSSSCLPPPPSLLCKDKARISPPGQRWRGCIHGHGSDRRGFGRWPKGQLWVLGISSNRHVTMAVNGTPSKNLSSRLREPQFEPDGIEDTVESAANHSADSATSDARLEYQSMSSLPDVERWRMSSRSTEGQFPPLSTRDKHGKPSERRERKPAEGKSFQKGNVGEDPYRIVGVGRKVYLDELDVLTLLDPPSNLRPFDINSYNHAAYLWKKIDDIPEERRLRLLGLLTPRQVSKMWEVAGLRYEALDSFEDSKKILLGYKPLQPLKPVVWIGQVNRAPYPAGWISTFKKAFFLGSDGKLYGRVVIGGWLFERLTSWLAPLYFEVGNAKKVFETGEPCNMAFDYGDGQLHIKDIPVHFPRPAKHPWPFNGRVLDYIRPVGPGMIVGQWWQESTKAPRKLLGEFVMIKDYLNTLK